MHTTPYPYPNVCSTPVEKPTNMCFLVLESFILHWFSNAAYWNRGIMSKADLRPLKSIVINTVCCVAQAWADAFRSSPDLTGVVHVYEEMKRKGIEFPRSDLETLSPIHTPQRVRLPGDLLGRDSACATWSTSSWIFWDVTITGLKSAVLSAVFLFCSHILVWWCLSQLQSTSEVDPKPSAPAQPKPAHAYSAPPVQSPPQVPNMHMAGPINPTLDQVACFP